MRTEALALKYRPINFDELIGQESVARTLSLALDSGRLGHAYLFSGLRGSGKTSSARIFARALVCEHGPKARPCGECANCLAANPHKMNHIDIQEMDAASKRGIDDIRTLIEHTKYAPSMARFKIFIIDEVHMLTTEAFNALLKTLEEPPSYVKFILATTDPLKLPATIISRAQHFRFKRISDKEILEHLQNILHKEKVEFENDALEMIIRAGAGSVRDTLTLLDQAILYTNMNINANATANMLGLINSQNLENLFNIIFNIDTKEISAKLSGYFEYECEMLLNEMQIFLKDRLFNNDSKYSLHFIDRALRIISTSHNLLKNGCSDDFVLLLTILKLKDSLKADEIDKIIESLENNTINNANFQANIIAPQIQNQAILAQKEEQNTQQIQSNNIESNIESTKTKIDSIKLFELLQNKIFELNYDLGNIFKENIRFISFENDELLWESSANAENKKRLADSYTKIRTFAQEIFGFNVKIKSITAQNINIDSMQNNKQENIQKDIESESIESEIKPKTKEEIEKEEVAAALASPLLKAAQEKLQINEIKAIPITQNTQNSSPSSTQ